MPDVLLFFVFLEISWLAVNCNQRSAEAVVKAHCFSWAGSMFYAGKNVDPG
jgi:hypothetical protein